MWLEISNHILKCTLKLAMLHVLGVINIVCEGIRDEPNRM
jgi:hypothetical protein